MIYPIAAEQISLRKRVIRTGFGIASFVIAISIFHLLFWPSPKAGRHSITDYWIDIAIAAVTGFFFDSVRKESSLVVTDEVISIRGRMISEPKSAEGTHTLFS